MKRLLIQFIALILAASQAMAQKTYEKIVYKNTLTDGKEITVASQDAVSTKTLTKFKIRITNKTQYLLIYKPEESTLILPGGKELKPQEKWLVMPPTETDSRVVNFSGSEFMIPEYSFKVEGVYKVSDIEKVEKAPDFNLPPSNNEFRTNNFTCTLLKFDKETDKTSAKFECRYNGDNVGVILPGRASVRLPDGGEIANAKVGGKPEVMKKGQSEKITLVWNRMEGGKETDMQKIKLVIVWHDTFVDAVTVKLDPVDMDMKIDETLSK